jgi:hypothetical protein
MSKTPKGDPRGHVPRGGPAGRHPGQGKMVGTRPDKWGKGPLPPGPRTPGRPPKDSK